MNAITKHLYANTTSQLDVKQIGHWLYINSQNDITPKQAKDFAQRVVEEIAVKNGATLPGYQSFANAYEGLEDPQAAMDPSAYAAATAGAKIGYDALLNEDNLQKATADVELYGKALEQVGLKLGSAELMAAGQGMQSTLARTDEDKGLSGVALVGWFQPTLTGQGKTMLSAETAARNDARSLAITNPAAFAALQTQLKTLSLNGKTEEERLAAFEQLMQSKEAAAAGLPDIAKLAPHFFIADGSTALTMPDKPEMANVEEVVYDEYGNLEVVAEGEMSVAPAPSPQADGKTVSQPQISSMERDDRIEAAVEAYEARQKKSLKRELRYASGTKIMDLTPSLTTYSKAS